MGAELREARKRAGLSMQQLGDQLGRAHSDVSRWESGKRLPSVADTAAVLGILGVTGPERDRLLQLAKDAGDPNWVAPGLNKQLAGLIADEKTAQRIINVEPLLVPGLLQTEDYARSIMRGAGATIGETDSRVLIRLGRQNVLNRRNAPDFLAVIGEHALRYPPCPPSMMCEQLDRLLTDARRPNITILVLPMDVGYSPALEGPFVLHEFDRGEPVVQQEHYRATTTLTDIRDVRDYRAAVDAIQRQALTAEHSATLISEVLTEMEQRT